MGFDKGNKSWRRKEPLPDEVMELIKVQLYLYLVTQKISCLTGIDITKLMANGLKNRNQKDLIKRIKFDSCDITQEDTYTRINEIERDQSSNISRYEKLDTLDSLIKDITKKYNTIVDMVERINDLIKAFLKE